MSSMQHAPINAAADSVSSLRIVLHGAMGRMGQRIAASIPAERGCQIIQAIDRDDELLV